MEKEVCSVTGKRMYSRKEADNLKNAALKKGNAKKRIPMRSYYCSYCGNYHLTHFKNYLKTGEKSTKQWYKKAKENYRNHIGEEI